MSRPLFLTALLAAVTAIGCQGTAPTGPDGEGKVNTGKPGKSGSARPATARPTTGATATAKPATGAPGTPGPTATAGSGTPGPTATPAGGGTPTPDATGTPTPTPTPVTTIAAAYTVAAFAGGTSGAGGADGAGAAAVLGRPDGAAGMLVEHGLGGVADALYFCDPANNQVRRALLGTAAVSRVAGATKDAGIQKEVNAPAGIAFDTRVTSYQLYFTEPPRSGVYREPRPVDSTDTAGSVSEVAGFRPAGTAYADGLGVEDGGGALASLNGATGLAIDGAVLYVADTGHHTIRTIAAARPYDVAFLAGGKGTAGAAVADADRAGARFSGPTALAIRGTGATAELIVADTGNHCIRAIDLSSATGRVKVLAGKPGTAGHDDGAAGAATFDRPVALAVDPVSGDVFVGELGTPRVRKVAKDGTVTTIAGGSDPGVAVGAAAAARFEAVCGLAVDVAGGKLVAVYAYDRGPAFEAAGQPGPRIVKLTPP